MAKKDYIRALQNKTKNLDLRSIGDFPESLYIFYSFDLVNSTLYKNRDKDWNSLFRHFFEVIQAEVKGHSRSIKVWKFVGDEVLLHQKVSSIDDLMQAPVFAYKAMQTAIQGLADYRSESKTVLSVKSTIWAALVETDIDTVSTSESSSTHKVNIRFKLQTDSNDAPEEDFLGQDVDIGFRIAKYSARDKLVVSANLAYLIYQIESKNSHVQNKISGSLKIVDYVKLKGIWGERYYPIIWYDTRWSSLDKMFTYDERKSNETIEKILSRGVNGQGNYEDVRVLQRVYDDLDMSSIATSLEDHVHKVAKLKTTEKLERRSRIPFDREAEVHFSVICITKNDTIMIVKRSKAKIRFGGKWEFGCVQLQVNQKVEDAIIQGYASKFGISFVTGEEITPFTTYSFNAEDDRIIPGIRFIAKIKTRESTIEKHLDRLKYSSVRFVSKNEIDSLPTQECVEGLKDALQRAFEFINR